jgi:hypothetical protein
MRMLMVCVCALAVLGCAIRTAAAPQQASSQRQQFREVKSTAGHASDVAVQPGEAEASSPANLPVRRVILYKSGVGYFEHVGRVDGDETVQIDFTSGQLNDVLQSLTILDLNGGRVAGVDYNSEAPLSERLGTLRLPLEQNTNISNFYGALRGARLEIRTGTMTITGRLLSVERKTRVSGGTTLEVDLATVVSDSGEVRSVEITPAVSVRLAEPGLTGEVSRYLGLLSSVREQDLRRLTIATAGSGDRQLYVSYISEVPVWKTTYRIVMPSKPGEQPLLQGWAIVDNTVGEDWNNIELSLVAGAPQSFIEQLSQPYYARRPVVSLPETAQLAPQTHESAMTGGLGALSGVVTDASGAVIPGSQVKAYSEATGFTVTATTDSQGRYGIDSVPSGNYRVEFSMPGFRTALLQGVALGRGREQVQNVTLQVGSTAETVTVAAQPSTLETENSDTAAADSKNVGTGGELGAALGERNVRNLPLNGRNYSQALALAPGVSGGPAGGFGAPGPAMLNDARSAMEAAASGSELGDLFEYKLKDRVTIRKNESALVPIVQAHVEAEKVSLWNAGLNSPRPLRALWLTNSSPLTLDGGSFSILENEAFAGEGLTDPIKPGERRLLSYAADLGVRVAVKSDETPQRITHVRIAHGTMVQTSELRQETTYAVRDDDTMPRVVLIEHPMRPGWTIAEDGTRPAETASGAYRFRVNVSPKSAAILTVPESKPLESNFAVTNITDDQIKLFVQQKSITPEIEAAFRKILEQKNRVAGLSTQISDRDDEKQAIYDDQQRLRENLKALTGGAEERALMQRYTQQLADQETRLDALKKESADLQAKQEEAQAELNKMIEELSLDATL